MKDKKTKALQKQTDANIEEILNKIKNGSYQTGELTEDQIGQLAKIIKKLLTQQLH